MDDLSELKIANTNRWRNAKLLRNFTSVARALVSPDAKTRYQKVESVTKVPWWFIAVVHERESSQNWRASLAQGDPWSQVSVHVPAGRGPFNSWEDAAIDALINCPPFTARNDDWSIGGSLTQLERYNGLGYFSRGLPSPYIWAGTDQYARGKFVRDGKFDPNAVDTQLGCAGLLKAMQAIDSSVLSGATIVPIPTKPPVVAPRKGSLGDSIGALFSAIAALFRRKP